MFRMQFELSTKAVYRLLLHRSDTERHQLPAPVLRTPATH